MIWLQSALAFAVVLGVVVLFHEYGHYLAAKRLGIAVEVFSIGFGPRIFGFRRGETEYRIAWIPLGGYVKLRGETADETAAGPRDPRDLLSRPRWQRFIVFVMGAVFNLLTAYVLTVVVLLHGVEEPATPNPPPIVGEVQPGSPAERAGLRPGDRVVRFAGRPIQDWRDLEFQIVTSPGRTVDLVLERDGATVEARLDIEAHPREGIGIPSFFPDTGAMIGKVVEGKPAAEAGLRKGDRIVSIDGVPITSALKVVETVGGSNGAPLHFVVERDGERFEKTIAPVRDGGRWVTGLMPTAPTTLRSYGLGAALWIALTRNLEDASLAFQTLKKLLTLDLSLRTVSGPVGLYLASGTFATMGLSPFLRFIAFVSLQLGIINLLPIPPLDGGHLATLVLEGTIRRDLSMQLKERLMQAGLILLLLFMGTVIYLDFSKLLQR